MVSALLDRACAVVRYYVDEMGMNPARFSAQGFADNRPARPNIDDKSRATNRRVDIVILAHKLKGKKKEFIWDKSGY